MRSAARTPAPSTCPANQKQAPATPAAPMLAMEIWFGVTDVAASQRVMLCAQAVLRLARGRRLVPSMVSVPFGLSRERNCRVPPSWSRPAFSCDRPPVAYGVKEDRCRKDDRIEPVDEAAMAGDEVTPILDAAVALDRRHDEATEEAHHHDDERQEGRLQRGERRHPRERSADHGGAQGTADQAFDRFRRR